MSLRITSRERNVGSFEIALDGRLDSATYQQLEAILDRLLNGVARSIQYDLTNLTYMSSMGLRLFLRTAKALKASGGKMAVTNAQPQIRKVFEIANALGPLSVFESNEEADRYLDMMQKRELAKKGGPQPG